MVAAKAIDGWVGNTCRWMLSDPDLGTDLARRGRSRQYNAAKHHPLYR